MRETEHIAAVDIAGHTVSIGSRESRADLGQFLTPPETARFMASLFQDSVEHVRLLDPGAGAGILCAAAVEAFLARKQPPRTIHVTAYEIDSRILPDLKKTIGECGESCARRNISFSSAICQTDFIASAVQKMRPDLFKSEPDRFSHVIMNPPYMKLNGETETRALLDFVGMGISNLYAAFLWLSANLLAPQGELVSITPRSFCNGTYFKRFRKQLLRAMSLRRVHVFESRKAAFKEDGVLQENIIAHMIRQNASPSTIILSASHGLDFAHANVRKVEYGQVVISGDADAFIHLPVSDADEAALARAECFHTTLADLGLEVSTGRVVSFRTKRYLLPTRAEQAAPLVHPCHLRNGFVQFSTEPGKRPNAIMVNDDTLPLLCPSAHYVLTKRFTSKEEARRIVAALYDPHAFEGDWVGFENHLNYFHARGTGIPINLARGLILYLNSSFFDRYFRLFSGHTQVNAGDLRKMRYPSRKQLLSMGAHMRDKLPGQHEIDLILEGECPS